MGTVWRSPFPDVVIPEREDLYGFLLDRAERLPLGRHGDDGRAGLRPDRRTWQPNKPALIDGDGSTVFTYAVRENGAARGRTLD